MGQFIGFDHIAYYVTNWSTFLTLEDVIMLYSCGIDPEATIKL